MNSKAPCALTVLNRTGNARLKRATQLSIRGINFLNVPPVVQSHPARADIALFAGFVSRRQFNGAFTPVPQPVQEFLTQNGWRSSVQPADPKPDALINVPVPIDSWDVFDLLFAWDLRPSVDLIGGTFYTYVGAAVRSFFQQGGRKCYVVAVKDPVRVGDQSISRGKLATALCLADGQLQAVDPMDPTSWTGVAHLLGLPDVSMVAVPDLPECVADPASPAPPLGDAAVPSPENFIQCSANDLIQSLHSTMLEENIPRGGGPGYADWTGAVGNLARWLSSATVGRQVQLIAALPFPPDGSAAERDLTSFLSGPLSQNPEILPVGSPQHGIASGFVQLAYPWLTSEASQNLPGGAQPPDGVLAGLIARNALTRGTFRSAAGQLLAESIDLMPLLSRDQTDGRSAADGTRLIDRVSLFGNTPNGIRLLSDVSTSLDPAYRPAGIHRLVAVILRAAQQAGQSLVFESSGPQTWNRVERILSGLLADLFIAGALNADTGSPYSVRCDRTTMTQNDLDSGRLVATVSFSPAYPVEAITVVLAMSEGGVVSLSANSSMMKGVA